MDKVMEDTANAPFVHRFWFDLHESTGHKKALPEASLGECDFYCALCQVQIGDFQGVRDHLSNSDEHPNVYTEMVPSQKDVRKFECAPFVSKAKQSKAKKDVNEERESKCKRGELISEEDKDLVGLGDTL